MDDLRFLDLEPRIHPTAQLKSCKLGHYVAIGERVVLREVSVGDFSYFERHAEAIYTSIGKFCSIAANTRINALEHPIERVTTHKISYRPNEYFRYLGVDAVVTKDVAPYEIVAGVPARRLRMRFPEPVAERMRLLAWWDWPGEKLFEALPDMQALTAEAFLEKWER